MVSRLACLFVLAVGSIYQDVIHSLNFHFFILKIQKYTFCILAFALFVFLALILIHMERLHLSEIAELN
jgi:hypothetical protein